MKATRGYQDSNVERRPAFVLFQGISSLYSLLISSKPWNIVLRVVLNLLSEQFAVEELSQF